MTPTIIKGDLGNVAKVRKLNTKIKENLSKLFVATNIVVYGRN